MLSVIIITFSYWYAVKNLAPTIIMFYNIILIKFYRRKNKVANRYKRKPQINWDNEYTMMKQNTKYHECVILYIIDINSTIYNK